MISVLFIILLMGIFYYRAIHKTAPRANSNGAQAVGDSRQNIHAVDQASWRKDIEKVLAGNMSENNLRKNVVRGKYLPGAGGGD